MSNSVKNIGLFILLMLSVLCFKNCNRYVKYKRAFRNSQKELKVSKDKNGLLVAELKQVEVSRNELKQILDTIKIKPKTKSITIIESNNTAKIKEVVKVKYDTIYIDNRQQINPVYQSNIDRYWYKGKVTATKDSIDLDLVYYDRLLLTIDQKRGLFRSKEATLKIRPQNPYVKISNAKNYKITNKEPLFNVSVQSGAGVNLLNGKPTIYLGVGIGYKIIR